MYEGEISSVATHHTLLKTEGQVTIKDLVTKYMAAIFIFKNSYINYLILCGLTYCIKCAGVMVSDSFIMTN